MKLRGKWEKRNNTWKYGKLALFEKEWEVAEQQIALRGKVISWRAKQKN